MGQQSQSNRQKENSQSERPKGAIPAPAPPRSSDWDPGSTEKERLITASKKPFSETNPQKITSQRKVKAVGSDSTIEHAKIAEKANAVLKQIAEQRKIDVIVQEAAYVSPKADVTDDVIKALNSSK